MNESSGVNTILLVVVIVVLVGAVVWFFRHDSNPNETDSGASVELNLPNNNDNNE